MGSTACRCADRTSLSPFGKKAVSFQLKWREIIEIQNVDNGLVLMNLPS